MHFIIYKFSSFPEEVLRDETTGHYYVGVDWAKFYRQSEETVASMIDKRFLMTDEEARDTGLLQG